MKLGSALFFLLGGSVFAGSVHIINDSQYDLVATIHSADGKNKGSVGVAPNSSGTWQDSEGGAYSWSQTPYQVTFTCKKSGQQYGIINGVTQAATVTASMASGARVCTDPKKKDDNSSQQNPSSLSGQDGQPSWENSEPPGDPNWGPP
ncbi:MAG: hypothetical protein AB7N99_05930 [Simkaniaceae bacterium]